MGGVIALDFVSRYRDRVVTLTLCDSSPGFGSLSQARRAEFIRLRQKHLLAGKEPRDIAPAVAQSPLGKNPRAGASDQLVASLSALHKQSYLKTIAATNGELFAKIRPRKDRRANPRRGRRTGHAHPTLHVARAGAPHPGRSPHDH